MSDKLREALEELIRSKWNNHPKERKNWDAADVIYDDCAKDLRYALAESGAAPAVGQLSEEQVRQAINSIIVQDYTIQAFQRDGINYADCAKVLTEKLNTLLRSEAAKELDKKP